MGAGRDSARWQRIAVSGQPIAVSASGCQLPAPGGRLPADRYLQADESLSACTEILRCAQDDCGRREGGCLKSDIWCLNVSVLSGIPLSGQRIADSGKRTAVQLSGGQSRNAVFIHRRRRYHHPRPEGPQPPSTQPAAVRRPQPSGPKAPSTFPPLNPLNPGPPRGPNLSAHWHRASFRDILSLITFGIRKLLDFGSFS